MAATELLCHLVGVDPSKLSREEILILEAELFARICEELREIFREQYRDYFRLMKFTVEKENAMLEANFVRLVIKDILSTEEYNLSGVAYYADTHEDVIHEVVDGVECRSSGKRGSRGRTSVCMRATRAPQKASTGTTARPWPEDGSEGSGPSADERRGR